jgi:hypothetical protein
MMPVATMRKTCTELAQRSALNASLRVATNVVLLTSVNVQVGATFDGPKLGVRFDWPEENALR